MKHLITVLLLLWGIAHGQAQDWTFEENGMWAKSQKKHKQKPTDSSIKSSAIDYLEYKIIDTDPSLEMAKETVPFDKLFYLRVPMPEKPPQGGQKVKIDSVITVTSAGEELVQTYSRETTVPKAIPPKSPTITKLILKKTVWGFSRCKSLDIVYYVDQSAKEKNQVLIELYKLDPETAYDLIIHWDNNGVKDTATYYMTTVSSSFESRAKERLTPTIGVASAYFKGREGSVFSERALIVGFYYHLRPINKSIPTRAYKPWAIQRISPFVGLSVTSMAEDYLRDDLIGDSNLFLGMGYTLIDGVTLGGGAMLFQEVNPNRLLSHQKQLASTLYFNMTVDLRVKDLVGGFITTLGFK